MLFAIALMAVVLAVLYYVAVSRQMKYPTSRDREIHEQSFRKKRESLHPPTR